MSTVSAPQGGSYGHRAYLYGAAPHLLPNVSARVASLWAPICENVPPLGKREVHAGGEGATENLGFSLSPSVGRFIIVRLLLPKKLGRENSSL